MKLPLVGALLLALSLLASPVAAQQCTAEYDVVFADLSNDAEVQSGTYMLTEIKAGQLPDFLALLAEMGAVINGEVTRAFLLMGPAASVVGLEIDGCLMPPLRINVPLPAKGSGRLPDGTIGA